MHPASTVDCAPVFAWLTDDDERVGFARTPGQQVSHRVAIAGHLEQQPSSGLQSAHGFTAAQEEEISEPVAECETS